MAAPHLTDSQKKAVARAVLDRHGETYAQEIGIKLDDNTPSALFQWLCAAVMFSAPIGAGQTVKGAKALFAAGLTTPKKMAEATWDERRRPLTEHGYARFDEKTASMLGDVAELVERQWHGDLRRLRDTCEGDSGRLRDHLKQVKGLGDVGVDIFFREVQGPWPELRPFADKRALKGARSLGLTDGSDGAEALAGLVAGKDLARFVAGLTRVDLANDADAIRAEATGED